MGGAGALIMSYVGVDRLLIIQFLVSWEGLIPQLICFARERENKMLAVFVLLSGLLINALVILNVSKRSILALAPICVLLDLACLIFHLCISHSYSVIFCSTIMWPHWHK